MPHTMLKPGSVQNVPPHANLGEVHSFSVTLDFFVGAYVSKDCCCTKSQAFFQRGTNNSAL